MLLLLSSTAELKRLKNHPKIGLLISPRRGMSRDYLHSLGFPWAADNDAFVRFNPGRFVGMLKRFQSLPGCLFVVAPDVVGDAVSTLTRFRMWQPVIRYFGYPVALAGQDNLEHQSIPWSDFDTLFLGGSTEWKLSSEAAQIVQQAKSLGKWTHMGRVNSISRIRYAQSIGIDSVDGTGYSVDPGKVFRHLPFFENEQLHLFNGKNHL